jgi:hypothetical protein
MVLSSTKSARCSGDHLPGDTRSSLARPTSSAIGSSLGLVSSAIKLFAKSSAVCSSEDATEFRQKWLDPPRVVGGLHNMGRLAEGGVRVAVLAQDGLGLALGHPHRGGGEVGGALVGDVALVPGDLKLLPRAVGLPPAIGHHGDAVEPCAARRATSKTMRRPRASPISPHTIACGMRITHSAIIGTSPAGTRSRPPCACPAIW